MNPLIPLMAAALAASSMPASATDRGRSSRPAEPQVNPVLPLGVSLPELPKVEAPKGQDAGGLDDTIDRLADLLKDKPAVRSSVAQRLADFLAKDYADPKANKSLIFASASSWVDETALGRDARGGKDQQKAEPKRAALLFYVMGPGDPLPAFIKSDSTLKDRFEASAKLGRASRLKELLKQAGWKDGAKIAAGREIDDAQTCLRSASEEAQKVFDERRPKEEAVASIKSNEAASAPTPPGMPSAPAPLSQPGGELQAYSFSNLYEDGAVTQGVYGGDDKNHRNISLKIWTVPGADGKPTEMLGICDITDRNRPICQPKSLDADDDFILDDRDAKNWKYKLKYTTGKNGEHLVTFCRPDCKDDDPGAIRTSVETLMRRRADQAFDLQNHLGFDGLDFLAVPQGGAKVGVAFLPRDLVNHRADVDGETLTASCLTYVAKRGGTGASVAMPGHPAIMCGGDVKPHRLAFNGQIGAWQIEEGQGDLPEPPKTDPGKDDGKGGGDGGNGKGGGKPTAPPTTPEERNAFDREVASDIAKGFTNISDQLKGLEEGWVPRVVMLKNAQMVKLIILQDTRLSPDGKMNAIDIVMKGSPKVEASGHYLIQTAEGVVNYFDVAELAALGNGENPSPVGSLMDKTAANGGTLKGVKVADRFRDYNAFKLALTRTLGVKDGDPMLKELPALAKAAAEDFEFTYGTDVATIGGNKTLLIKIQFFDDSGKIVDERVIWPKDQATKSQQGNVAPAPRVQGQGGQGQAQPQAAPKPAAGQGGAASPAAPAGEPAPEFHALPATADAEDFKDEISLNDPPGAKAKVQRKVTDAALYETDKADAGFPLFYKFKAKNDTGVLRSAPFFIHAFKKIPADIQVQGMVAAGQAVEDKNTQGAMEIAGTTEAKGAVALFQQKQLAGSDNVRKSAPNCVGPLAWWGMTRDQAQKACEQGKIK